MNCLFFLLQLIPVFSVIPCDQHLSLLNGTQLDTTTRSRSVTLVFVLDPSCSSGYVLQSPSLLHICICPPFRKMEAALLPLARCIVKSKLIARLFLVLLEFEQFFPDSSTFIAFAKRFLYISEPINIYIYISVILLALDYHFSSNIG